MRTRVHLLKSEEVDQAAYQEILQQLQSFSGPLEFVSTIDEPVFDDDEKIFLSLKAGAEGYILKSTSNEKIIQYIEDVFNGGAVMNPSIALRVTKFFNNNDYSNYQLSQELTVREMEILQL